MACLDMYNNSQPSLSLSSSPSPSPSPPPPPPPSMSPRISFSNDFVESQNSHKSTTTTTTSSSSSDASPDFEFFSLSNPDMMSADELFFKGRLLPFKHNTQPQMHRTLKDQLLYDEEEDEDEDDDDDEDDIEFSIKPLNKGSSSYNKWKGFLGIRKHHILGSKKTDAFTFAIEDPSSASPSPSPASTTNSSKDALSTGSPSNTHMEMGI